MKKPTNIAEQLRDAIQRSDWTIYRIGKESGVADIVISRFVSRERDVKLGTAAKLCIALKLKLVPEGGK